MNGKRTVVTKGTPDRAVAKAPDVCKVPGTPPPVPFDNYALSADLQSGTATVLIADQPVFTSAGRLEPSLPAHAGKNKGVVSGAYQGAVTPVSYSNDVHAEGHPVVRTLDDTKHNRGNTAGQILPAAKDGKLDALPSTADCKALWAKYLDEAKRKIAPAGDNHRLRNKIITGAYADLFLQSKGEFTWAGLAAYASKQVGCAMDFSQTMKDAAPAIGVGGGAAVPLIGPIAGGVGGKIAGDETAGYMLNQLGKGNRDLFLDIYPQYRFYQDLGWPKFFACANDNPKMTSFSLNGFAALARGDGAMHLDYIAWHEQTMVLQPLIYDDKRTEALLWLNERRIPGTSIPLPGTSPAQLTLSAQCEDPSRPRTNFSDYGTRLWDVPQRMDWIRHGAAPLYNGMMGSPEHLGDLTQLSQTGQNTSAALGGGRP